MNAELQTIGALAVVAIAATWLVLRVFLKKKSASGCGGECGCPSSELKAQLKR